LINQQTNIDRKEGEQARGLQEGSPRLFQEDAGRGVRESPERGGIKQPERSKAEQAEKDMSTKNGSDFHGGELIKQKGKKGENREAFGGECLVKS